MPGWGWYDRETNPRGTLLPQEITEFTNAGLMAGMATVNLADDPLATFNGFWGACSTYGSFSYLKYGRFRLFSQLAQDTQLKLGKVIWVAGHSGPETAEDSRTHFGIFATGVTQLFPEGHVIDLHPWEYNEVPVVLRGRPGHRRAHRGAAPDPAGGRDPGPGGAGDGLALRGGARRLPAARRAIRSAPWPGRCTCRAPCPPRTWSRSCPSWMPRGINVRIVAAISPQLFRRQDAAYRERICSDADRWTAWRSPTAPSS